MFGSQHILLSFDSSLTKINVAMQRPNSNKKTKVQLVISFILVLELFKSFSVVIFVSMTNPHVQVTISAPAGVAGLLADNLVICIVRFEVVLWIMTFHTNLCLVTNSVPFLDVHLDISRAPRGIVVEMVIIQIISIAFCI